MQLVEKYRSIFYYVGRLLRFVAIVLLLPLLSLLFYPHEWYQGLYFVVSSILAFIVSQVLIMQGKNHQLSRLVNGQDALIVVFTWFFAMVFSSLPFILSGHLTPLLGMFEAVSGWSTTGLSVVDVNAIESIYLLFRSIIQFFGGLGLVLVVFAILSESYGLRLYFAEGHNDRLMPNLSKSARVVLKIYSVYLIVGIILLMIFGMSLFEAINIAMTALSTGGFAITADSIGAYQSQAIESVIIGLMIIGNTNFAGHLLLFGRKLKRFVKLDEFKYLIFSIIFLTSWLMVAHVNQGISIRVALFEAVSAITTTGFTITTYQYWPSVALMLLIIFMVIGGGAGSTAGGLKQVRFIIMIKSVILGIKKKFLPKQVVKDIVISRGDGDLPMDDTSVLEVYQLFLMYLALLVFGSLIIASYGYPFIDALFEFTSALGTVGTSVGITSMHAPSGVLIIEMIGMFFGRLEIMIVVLAMIVSVKDVRLFLTKSRKNEDS